MKKRILVVAAHPDDETLGCGGLISNFSKKGHTINTIIIGEGSSCNSVKTPKTQKYKNRFMKEKKVVLNH